MANEIRDHVNSVPKMKNDFKQDWKEDVRKDWRIDWGSDLASAPVNTVAPAITGTLTVGQTLTCSTGTWTGSGITYTYAWTSSAGKKILGTAATYVLTTAEQTKTMTCTVTAINSAGEVAAKSNTTAAIS